MRKANEVSLFHPSTGWRVYVLLREFNCFCKKRSSSRALEAPGLEINIFIKRTTKEKIGFGQGTQIGKSNSRALEASRLEINMFVKRIDKEKIGFR